MLGAGGAAGLAGCSGDTQNETSTQLESSATIALKMDPTVNNLRGAFGVAPYYTTVFEPLVWASPDMEKQPWLAESWERTDEKTYEFTLRDGVTFHNGEPLTAEEVVWSFQTILNSLSYVPAWLHMEADGVTALDDLTVEIALDDAFPTFPGTIAHNLVSIQYPYDDPENAEPIGTGPYQVEAINSDSVEVSAHDEYWKDPAKTSNLTFRYIRDPNTRMLALEGNDVDVAVELPYDKLDAFENSSDMNVTSAVSGSSSWVYIHTEKVPTNDAKLRQAFNYAVSQEAIVESVNNGVGKPARGVISPEIPWSAHEELPEYGPDKEQAATLVEESSYNGETLQFFLKNGEPVNGDALAAIIQSSLGEIGVDVEIQNLEEAAYTPEWQNGTGHLYLESRGTRSAAADYQLYDLFLSAEAGGCCSNWYQLGEEFDSLITEGSQTIDPEEKEEAYVAAQQIMMEQAVVIPLYYEEYLVGSYRDIEGVTPHPIRWMTRWTNIKHNK